MRYIKMMIKKLTKMPYAKAHIEICENGDVYLYSYATLVAELTADKWLTIFGLHSMTTRRHISAFCNEYCGVIDYYYAKSAYEGGFSVNIETGELAEEVY